MESKKPTPIPKDFGPTLEKPPEPVDPPWYREAIIKINNDLHLLAANPSLGKEYL